MSQISNYAETKIYDLVCRNTAWAVPTPYVALYTSATDDASGGTEVSTAGTNYARQLLTMSSPTAGTGANSSQVTFGVATADWGLVTHYRVLDAVTAGNPLFYGQLQQGQNIVTGSNSYIIGAGQLSLQIAGDACDYLRNKIYDHMVRGISFTPPAAVYLALYSGATDQTGTGTELSFTNAYARVSIVFGASTDGAGSNSAQVTFPTAGPSAWASFRWVAIKDASTGGNMLAQKDLGGAITISAGGNAYVAAGNLDFQVM